MDAAAEVSAKLGAGSEQTERETSGKAAAAPAQTYKVTEFTLAAGRGNVLCVDDSPSVGDDAIYPKGCRLVRGQIYRALGIVNEDEGLVILGLPVLCVEYGCEIGWRRDRFRVQGTSPV